MPNAAIAVRSWWPPPAAGSAPTGTPPAAPACSSSRMVMITSGSRLEISAARSTLLAVEPPTNAYDALAPCCFGITVERRCLDQVGGRLRRGRGGRDHAVDDVVALLGDRTAATPACRPWSLISASCSLTSRGSVPRTSPPALVSVVHQLAVQLVGLLLLLLGLLLQRLQLIALLLEVVRLCLQLVSLLLQRGALLLERCGLRLQRGGLRLELGGLRIERLLLLLERLPSWPPAPPPGAAASSLRPCRA